MTLRIELTAQQEARLVAAAREEGLAPAELAQRLLADRLPAVPVVNGGAREGTSDDAERGARVRSIRGKYAGVGVTSEDLRRERQADEQRGPSSHGQDR